MQPLALMVPSLSQFPLPPGFHRRVPSAFADACAFWPGTRPTVQAQRQEEGREPPCGQRALTSRTFPRKGSSTVSSVTPTLGGGGAGVATCQTSMKTTVGNLARPGAGLVPVTPSPLPSPLRGGHVSGGAWQRGGPGAYRIRFAPRASFLSWPVTAWPPQRRECGQEPVAWLPSGKPRGG